jgi:hypothetical protein
MGRATIKRSGNYRFREGCACALMKYGGETLPLPRAVVVRIQQYLDNYDDNSSHVTPVKNPMASSCEGEHKVLSKNVRNCAIYLLDSRKTSNQGRNSLSELSSNPLIRLGGRGESSGA